VDAAVAGDTVLVKDGFYREEAEAHQAGVKITRSGAPDAWIRIKAYPGSHPRVTSPTWGTIRLVQVAYIEIDGFDVSTEIVQGQTDANFQRNEGNGVYIERSHHVVVRNVRAHDCGGGGIGSAYSDYLTVEDNDVRRNAFYSIYNCSGISLWECRDLDKKPGFHDVIRGNKCTLNENKGPTPLSDGKLTDGEGIIIDGSLGTGAILIENNVAWDNGGQGIQINHARNVVVRNNTCAWNERTPDVKQSDLTANWSENCIFENNIVVARPGQNKLDDWQSSAIVYRNNLLFGYGSVSPAVGSDNLVGRDPLFRHALLGDVDPDFRLMPGSPAIEKSPRADSPDFDVEHRARPKNRPADIGAFQR